MKFKSSDFVQVSDKEAPSLFKICAAQKIKEIPYARILTKIQYSIKYQVLIEDTAIVGKMKQFSKETGKMELVETV